MRRTAPRGPPAASSSDELRERGAGELPLRDEPARTAAVHEGSEVRAVTARRQDHEWGAEHAGDARSDVEAVEVREVDVQQHQIGMELPCRSDGAHAVRGLTDHVEPLAL